MADDNIIKFNAGRPLTTIHAGETVLVIRPDGTKLRGGDMVPLDTLPREALLKVIDQLCNLIARR